MRFIAIQETIDIKGEKINGDVEATVDNVVDGLDLLTISHSRNMLQISGQALTEVEVLDYGRNLDDTGRFSEITAR